LIAFAGDWFWARLVAIVANTTLLFCLGCQAAKADDAVELKIKAAYLYNFTKFITWPATSAPTFNFCVIGLDPFNELLDSLESKTAQDKPIRVFRFDSVKQAKDCQILYDDKNTAALKALGPGILSVSSQTLFAESGGMIGFVLEDDKIKLHINLGALRQSGLSISAKLIEVSTLVKGDEHD